MKVVILAGGLGSRIEEETVVIPKPLVRVNEYPILWHIMKIYSHYGYNDFIICLGYKGYLIKEYFANYFLHQSDVTFDFTKGYQKIKFHNKNVEDWKVTLIDTGLESQTGARLRRIQDYIKEKTFLMTYGDAVADVDISALVDFHKSHHKHATVTIVQPPGRYGQVELGRGADVRTFEEKPKGDGGYINGGFFVLNKEVFKYLNNDEKLIWEREPLKKLVADRQIQAYTHRGFWRCMDTLRDKRALEVLGKEDKAPWMVWT